MNERNVNELQAGHHYDGIKALSWTGVIAGALVATGLGFLLNLFDVGIGLAVDPPVDLDAGRPADTVCAFTGGIFRIRLCHFIAPSL